MEGPKVELCRASQWPVLLAFLAAMNIQEGHHIGYLGTDIPSILDDLADIPEPLHEAFLVADDKQTQKIIGTLGVDTDAEIGRAWLYGPFVDQPSSTWNLVAEALYAKAMAAIPSGIIEHELCIGTRNHRVEAFAKYHGFVPFSHSVSLSINRDRLLPPHTAFEEPQPIEPQQHKAFIALQERLFPRTYYTGRQILDRVGDDAQVFVIDEGEGVVGHIFVRVSPHVGTGSIEFVGVSRSARRRGIGSRLVSTALAWVFAHESIDEISLTVSVANEAALALYKKLGFKRDKEIVGFRRVGLVTR